MTDGQTQTDTVASSGNDVTTDAALLKTSHPSVQTFTADSGSSQQPPPLAEPRTSRSDVLEHPEGDGSEIPSAKTSSNLEDTINDSGVDGIYNSTDHSGAAASWESAIKYVENPPRPKLAVASELVDQYAAILREQRLVVIVHTPANYWEAVSGMYAILDNFRVNNPGQSLYTSGVDEVIPLFSFYRVEDWPMRLRHSVIYFNRSTDQAASTFFDDYKLRMLREQLKRAEARMVLTVSTVEINRQTDQAQRADRSFWMIDSPRGAATADCSKLLSEPFETMVVCCAALFPGLGVAEFVNLVQRLMPRKDVVQNLAPPPSPGASEGPGLQVPALVPTREDRWWRGERDAVLAELDICFSSPPEVSDSKALVNDAGYYLADEEMRATMPDIVLARFPILLTQHLALLSSCYFSQSASARFRAGYLNLLFRLDKLNIHRLSAQWLLNHFRTFPESAQPFVSANLFRDLLVRTLDRNDGESLVKDTLDGLSKYLVDEEASLFNKLPQNSFVTALLQALDLSTGDTNDVFWRKLRESQSARIPLDAAELRLLLVLHLLVAFSRYLPLAVSGAIKRIFDESALADSRWFTLIGRERLGIDRLGIDRLARKKLQLVLDTVIEHDPELWVVFARAVVDERGNEDRVESKKDRNKQPTRDKTPQESLVTKRLAIDCLRSLAELLPVSPLRPIAEVLYDALISDGRQVRTGQLLCDLLRWAFFDNTTHRHNNNKSEDVETFDAGFVVWLYRSLTQVCLLRPQANPSAIAILVNDLARPLRSSLHSSRRLALSDRARDLLERYMSRREHFYSLDKRDQVRVESRRIQAMHIVIRAFSGTTLKSAT